MNNFYSVKINHVPGGPVSASDQNRRGLILNAQLNLGALGAFGSGVLSGWEVTKSSGGTISISAGRGITYSEDNGYIALLTEDAETFETEEEAPYYIFAEAVIGAVPTDADSRLDLLPRFVAYEADTMDGAVLLARVAADGTVEDKRDTSFLLRIAQLESDLGYDSSARAKGSVHERLDALSAPIDEEDGNETTIAQLRAAINAALARISDLEEEVAALRSQIHGEAPTATRLPGREEALRADVDEHLLHNAQLYPRIAQVVEGITIVTPRTAQNQNMRDGSVQRDAAGGAWPVE